MINLNEIFVKNSWLLRFLLIHTMVYIPKVSKPKLHAHSITEHVSTYYNKYYINIIFEIVFGIYFSKTLRKFCNICNMC